MCIECFVTEKHWTDLLSGLAIPVIGFVGAYIAWRQWQTAAYRFKLDLFDKRFEIYNATIDFIYSIRGGGVVYDKHLAIFNEKTLPARFLFDDNLSEYLSEIREKALDIQCFTEELNGVLSDEERGETIQKLSEIKKWLYHQIDENTLNNNFGTFLKIQSNYKFLKFIINVFHRLRKRDSPSLSRT